MFRHGIFFVLSLFVLAGLMSGAEQAFEMTQPGTVELKTLPAGRLLESRSEQPYFSSSNNLFGPLFRYISRNNISMTTPVEARMNPGSMYFWVASDQVDKASANTNSVRVLDVPERKVASIGARGSYSETNYEAARKTLMEWLAQQESIKAIGEPYAVFWHGPFTPWFMKTFEVHVEVSQADV